MSHKETLLSITELKNQARKLKKSSRCKQSEALDAVAQKHGFSNWSLLSRNPRCRALEWFFQRFTHAENYPSTDDFDYGYGGDHCDVEEALRNAASISLSENSLVKLAAELEEEGPWVSREAVAAVNWFYANHSRAVDESPWNGREGGYLYPTIEDTGDIQDLLCRQFPKFDERLLWEIAGDLAAEDIWISKEWLDEMHKEAQESVLYDQYADLQPPSLSNFDGWSFAELYGTNNPMGAEELISLVSTRRRKRLCDLCGSPLHRAARPANDGAGKPMTLRHGEANTNASKDKDSAAVIGTFACEKCRTANPVSDY